MEFWPWSDAILGSSGRHVGFTCSGKHRKIYLQSGTLTASATDIFQKMTELIGISLQDQIGDLAYIQLFDYLVRASFISGTGEVGNAPSELSS